jgi:hypothetical protein
MFIAMRFSLLQTRRRARRVDPAASPKIARKNYKRTGSDALINAWSKSRAAAAVSGLGRNGKARPTVARGFGSLPVPA